MSDRSLLETFPNSHPSRDYVIEHISPEFTSMCPKTGHPDYAEISISYVADEKCVELKSLKFYLHAFRNTGIFYEAVTNTILEDLVAALEPRRMTVVTRWKPRGGLSSVITASYP
jgi:7-cyano-7-deazaguanine reductase